MYTAQVSKFVSTTSTSGWGQVHDFTPQEDEKILKRGRLIAVISMQGFAGSQLEAINVGREILTRLHEEYYGDLTKPSFEALKSVLTLVSQEFSNDLVHTTIGALALLGNKILFAATDNIVGFVLRQGNLAQILNSTKNLHFGAGEIRVGDSFLIGTNAYFQHASEGIVKAALEKPSAIAIIETLAPSIYQAEKAYTPNSRSIDSRNNLPIAVALKIVSNDFVSSSIDSQEFLPEKKLVNNGSHTDLEVNSLKAKLVGVIDTILQTIPERKISVGPNLAYVEEGKNKKRMIFIGAILLILLVVSIVFGGIQRGNKMARDKYEDRLLTSQHQLEEAKTLSAINQARARELLIESRNTLLEIKNEGVKDERVDQTLAEINKNISTIAGIYEVTPEMYLDLGLLTDEFEGKDLSISDGRMLVLDTKGRLVSVTVNSKKTRVLVGPEKLVLAKSAAVYSDRNFVLTEEEIVEVLGQGTKNVIDKDWDDAKGIHAFAANIYLLDKGKNEILRYVGGSDGFGSGKDWFAPGIKVDLTNVVSWSIDGSIWFLTTSGEIEKYQNGNPQTFVLSGLEGNLAGANDIFSDDVTTYLYVLDKDKGRIVVLEKNGNYKAEYISDQIKGATKIVVSEEEKKIILLSNDKLYAIEAKHL